MSAGLLLLNLKKSAGFVLYMTAVIAVITSAACVCAIYARAVMDTFEAELAKNYKYGVYFNALVNTETMLDNADLFNEGAILSINNKNVMINGQSASEGKVIAGADSDLLKFVLGEVFTGETDVFDNSIYLSSRTAESIKTHTGERIALNGIADEEMSLVVAGIYESDFTATEYVVCLEGTDLLCAEGEMAVLVIRNDAGQLYAAQKVLEKEGVFITDNDVLSLYIRVRTGKTVLTISAAVILCAGIGVFVKGAAGRRKRNRKLTEICFRSGLSIRRDSINEAVFLYAVSIAGVALSAAVSAICVAALNGALARYYVIYVDAVFAALMLLSAAAVYISSATIFAVFIYNKVLRRESYECYGQSDS